MLLLTTEAAISYVSFLFSLVLSFESLLSAYIMLRLSSSLSQSRKTPVIGLVAAYEYSHLIMSRDDRDKNCLISKFPLLVYLAPLVDVVK